MTIIVGTTRVPVHPAIQGLSLGLAMCNLPLPTTATPIGAVNHPISGRGGLLVRFSSGCYSIQQCGSYRSVPRWFGRKMEFDLARRVPTTLGEVGENA